MPETCDRCGRKLKNGRWLWAARVQTLAAQLGVYGKACAAVVAFARSQHGMPTFNADGLELDEGGRIVPGQRHE